MLPLILKMKKEVHKRTAQLQDLLVQELFSFFDNAVLHGGTAIWRCYNGNRFSEDIDIYLVKDEAKINLFFSKLEKVGFIIEKKKFTDNSLYSSLRLDRTLIKFEIIFKKVKGVLKEYTTVEGNLISVYTLSPEELIIEKINAYLNRLKIRDLYDLFFLLRYVNNRNILVNKINKLIKKYKHPNDETDLKILIIEGLIPTSAKILEYIKSWEKKNI